MPRTPALLSTVAVALALVWLLPGSGRAAEGVVEINQAAATAGGITPGDTPGLPVTLSQGGSYRLTGNLLTNNRAVTLIEITAARVHLDLGGFIVGQCIGGGLCGIGTARAIDGGSGSQIDLVNGTVGGSGGNCVALFGGPSVVSDLRLVGCENGLRVSPGSRVSHVTVDGCGGTGVVLGAGSILRDTVIRGCGFAAVEIDSNVLILDSMIRDNERAIVSSGGSIFESGGYGNCVISRNGGLQEIQPISGPVRNLGGNICGSDTFCP